jgi:energy-coupling factor transport system permease protein
MLNSPALCRQNSGKQEGNALGEKMPHPALQIYIWFCLTLAVQMLGAYSLIPVAGILIAFAFRMCAARFFFLLRRTRWILFSMFLIYAYTSPGEVLWPHLGIFSPVAEGVEYGLKQLLHLLAALAGLSILLTLLSQTQLIAGLYMLCRPLSLLGVSRERFAVRLALTLRYAESAMQDTATSWRGSIEQLLAQLPLTPGYIELQLIPFTRRDGLLAVAASVAMIGVWL